MNGCSGLTIFQEKGLHPVCANCHRSLEARQNTSTSCPEDTYVTFNDISARVKKAWREKDISWQCSPEIDKLFFSNKLLREIDENLLSHLVAPFFSKKNVSLFVHQLFYRFCQAPFHFSLVKLFTTIGVLNPAVSQELEKFVGRFVQLSKLPYKLHQLTLSEWFSLAHFLEFQEKGSGFYHKKEDYNIARTVVITPDSTFILSKRKVSIFNIDGDSKKFTSAIHLPPLHMARPATIIAQFTYKGGANRVGEKYRKEVRIHSELRGQPGIWPLIGIIGHEKRSASETAQVISGFMPLASWNLTLLRHFPYDLSLLQHVKDQLIVALSSLYRNGYVHGDIRLEHVLCKNREGGGCGNIGLVGFSHAFKVGVDEMSEIFKRGFTPTSYLTPPELFGNACVSAHPHKWDIWAVGFLLFQLHFNRQPSWTEIVKNAFNRGDIGRLEECLAMRSHIIKEIEQPRNKLLHKLSRTKVEEFELSIYNMMRFNPQERIF